MPSFKNLFMAAVAATATQAYSNKADCVTGISHINPNTQYSDQAQFSSGDCYIIYATNNAGPQPISGQVLIDTANDILDECSSLHGSYGTNNCASCHVTVNYRS
ncbi:hypothetical protein F4825DRAFT_457905 [Nemania diffusa]|nr:hypothetical protein F4825DRAFT_457905 [Nemania diffusa]